MDTLRRRSSARRSRSLRPAFRELDDANKAVLPLVKEGTPIVRDEIRPFARIARPTRATSERRPARLAEAGPDLTDAFREPQPLLQHRRVQPEAAPRSSTGNPAADRNRQEGYLYWLALGRARTPSASFSTARRDRADPARLGSAASTARPLIVRGSSDARRRSFVHRRGGRDPVRLDRSVRQVNKQAPSLGRILAMVVFAMSCFGLLLFLWLAFGGPVPLKPQSYRVKVNFPEAATLAQEADVRMAGVNVGTREDEGAETRTARAGRTVELEIKERVRAAAGGHEGDPAPEDAARRDLRRAEPGLEGGREARRRRHAAGRAGRRRRSSSTRSTTRSTSRPGARSPSGSRSSTRAIKNGRGQDLNDAFGNLEGFAIDGADLLEVLDEQEHGGCAT